jgi:SAM-dependent methyltransferase
MTIVPDKGGPNTVPPTSPDDSHAMRAFWSANSRNLEDVGWSLPLFAERLLPAVRDKQVLELGCGAGHLSIRLASATTVTGVDFVPELLQMARSQASAFAPHSNVRFVEQDLLTLELGQKYDCICGVGILHEIPVSSYPLLIQRLKHHLRPGGFCLFLENSFFNGFYRLLRRHVVGHAGFRKVGSADELPFDHERWSLIQSQFRYSDRRCDVFVLFDRVWYQFLHQHVGRILPSAAAPIGDACARVDQFVSRSIPPNLITRYWSWLQTIYFSDHLPRDGAFAPYEAP